MATATTRRARAARGHGDRLREEIIAATRHLLEVNGDAAAITLRGVAREVGVTPTSIYLHFDDTDALISVVKQQLFGELGDAMEKSVPAGADPVAVVRGSAHAYVSFAFENAGLYGALFTSKHVAPPNAPARRSSARRRSAAPSRTWRRRSVSTRSTRAPRCWPCICGRRCTGSSRCAR